MQDLDRRTDERAVQEGQSVRQAARDYGVSWSTLRDRVLGRVVHGVKPGPKPYLDAINKDTLGQYFSILKDVMEEHSLYDKPSQIYNIDESGVPLDPRPQT